MKCFFCFIVCLLIPVWLWAESSNESIELTLFSGYSFSSAKLELPPPCSIGVGCEFNIPGFTNSIDDSIVFGLNVGYYFNKNIELEGNFAIQPSHTFRFSPNSPGFDLFSTEINIVTYNYDVNFVYNVDWKGVRPFVTAGIGGVTRDRVDLDTDFVFNFGGGAKFYYKDIGFRLNVNDHLISDYFELGKTEHDIQIQSGIMFSFD